MKGPKALPKHKTERKEQGELPVESNLSQAAKDTVAKRLKLTAALLLTTVLRHDGAPLDTQHISKVPENKISHAAGENPEDQVERRLWDLINRVEEGMASFFQEHHEKWATHKNPKLTESFDFLFNLIEKNKLQNPFRNYVTFQRSSEDKIAIWKFLYAAQAPRGNAERLIMASFDSEERVLLIPEDFDPNDIIDILSVCHEGTHAADDTAMRTVFFEGKLPAYGPIVADKKKVIINWEIKAFVYQIELLNSITDGFLHRAVAEGRRIDDEKSLDEIAHRVKLDTSSHAERSRIALKDLLILGQIYFENGGLKGDRVPPAFYHDVFKRYRDKELQVYDGRGNFLPLTASNLNAIIEPGSTIYH